MLRDRPPMPMSRKEFVRISAGAAVVLGAGGRRGLLSLAAPEGNPLRRAPEVSPDGLTLVARVGTADIGGGTLSPAWMLNQSMPSPLIRVRRGELFRVRLDNQLPRDPLILHWHGLTPPESSDGHPRLAVSNGQTYDYGFTVNNRAGTYWYHSHAHMRTAKHTYLGIAGMLLVEDDEERALGLPSGEWEIPLILQDRTLTSTGRLLFDDGNLMSGRTGPEAFGNGVHRPWLAVDRALYRFRILNGSNARIFRLEWSDGRPLVLIGNDGGLLSRRISVPAADVGPGERLDVLLDLSDAGEGDVLTLRSQAFRLPLGRDVIEGATEQGAALDLLQLRVGERRVEAPPVPEELCVIDGPDPAAAVRERTLRFGTDTAPQTQGLHIRHHINERAFDMERVDHHVPFGDTEIWSLSTDMQFAHPVHLHGTHFRVLSRSGGRGQVMPWEAGLKDTVLVHAGETVRVAVRFTAERGLFMVHCHNLEHEDMGMMANVLVE